MIDHHEAILPFNRIVIGSLLGSMIGLTKGSWINNGIRCGFHLVENSLAVHQLLDNENFVNLHNEILFPY